jgi:hypothetical protein
LKLRTWWMAWGDLVRKLVALDASFASMAGLLLAFLPALKDLPSWAVAVLVVAVVAFITLVALEFTDRRGRRVYAKDDTQGIKRYMHSWIEHGGRVAIWTRDMSWAQNPETHRLLTEKAGEASWSYAYPRSTGLPETSPQRAPRCALMERAFLRRRRHGSRSSSSAAMARGWRSGALRGILMSSMSSAPATTQRSTWLPIL